MRTLNLLGGVIILLGTCQHADMACSQQTDAPAAEQQATDSEETASRLAIMQQAAAAITLQVESLGSKPTEVPLLEQAVLRFNDPARSYQDGTLWLYGNKGRPVAALEIWSNDIRLPSWFHSITSTSSARPIGSFEGRIQWRPQAAGIAFQPVPGGPPVSATSVVRQRQLKALARQFEAYEVFRGDRSELRLLAKPLHEYNDSDSQVLHGGVFLFTHGTNPELLLLLEAVQGEEQRQWRYAFAPSGSAAFHASHDKEEVWTLPAAADVTGTRLDPYWLFPREVVAEE